MKRIFSIAIIVFLAVSCGNNHDEESIRQQIKEYKEEVSELNIKIKELERSLEEFGDSGKVNTTPVVAKVLEKESFYHYFQVNGTVEALDQAYISPEISGQVHEILVLEGETVQKGQLLAKLSTSITENTIAEVKTQFNLAETLYEKQSQLWEKNIGSEVQYLQAKNNMESLKSKLETLQAQLEMAYITSPVNGIVDRINVEEGELAMPGMQMMLVVNLQRMKIIGNVSEKYLPVIHKGDLVTVNFPTYPGLEMEVRVARTGNVVNPGNRTFQVELRIDNIQSKLKPNILALITFLDYSNEEALVIPSLTIKKDLKGEYIYLAKNIDGKYIAKKVYITTGMSYQDDTEVLEGLKPGDRVITKGYTLVTDGSEVKLR